ncbi:MAG: hypothetical protein ACI9PP_001742 [Halobacteriales archaeon]|jgi:hypothetical protein
MNSIADLTDEDRARAAVEAAEQVRATLRAHPDRHVDAR